MVMEKSLKRASVMRTNVTVEEHVRETENLKELMSQTLFGRGKECYHANQIRFCEENPCDPGFSAELRNKDDILKPVVMVTFSTANKPARPQVSNIC
ncbi:hypothetical protein BTVI_141345 [Pitangus sulphuratus]|nr:hypothetical protein BTVI_141345 [Pitangus sulphuratus]